MRRRNWIKNFTTLANAAQLLGHGLSRHTEKLDQKWIKVFRVVIIKAVFNINIFQCIFSQISSPKKSNKTIRENFYLSWSEADESYCLKAVPRDRIPQTDNIVEIRISHISTPAGQCTKLLHNVKSPSSCKLQQAVVGKVITTSEKTNGFKIGDEVIAILNSKWIKDRIRLPTTDVFLKPEFLTCEEAAVLPGNEKNCK